MPPTSSPRERKVPRILGAKFERTNQRGAAMRLYVFAQNLYIGGAPLFARVGNQQVSNLIPIRGGRGFTATLGRVPAEGERLFLHYLGRLEARTEVVFHSEPPRVA